MASNWILISYLYRLQVVEKVICNGNHTDDWIHDEETGNSMGEWDLMDFANQIFTSEIHSYRSNFYNIERKGNEIRVWYNRGDWSEDYTLYLAYPREIQDLIQEIKNYALEEEDKWYESLIPLNIFLILFKHDLSLISSTTNVVTFIMFGKPKRKDTQDSSCIAYSCADSSLPHSASRAPLRP